MGVREHARTLLAEARSERPARVRLELRALEDGSLAVAFEADVAGRHVQRALTVASCHDARQAAGLLLALSLGAEPPDASAAPPPTANPAPAHPPAAPREPEREPRSDAALIVAVSAGLELPGPSSVRSGFGAGLGLRLGALQLEASGNLWLRARGQLDDDRLAVDMAGGAASACHGFAFGAWELGPCLGLELSRVQVELNGMDAGSAAWLRASLGPRLACWSLAPFVLSVSADALLALRRPRFSAGGRSARVPALGFVPRIGLAYAFGAKGAPRAQPF